MSKRNERLLRLRIVSIHTAEDDITCKPKTTVMASCGSKVPPQATLVVEFENPGDMPEYYKVGLPFDIVPLLSE